MTKDPAAKYHARSLEGHDLSPHTLMMGYGYSTKLSEGAIKAPLFQTSTFTFNSAEDGKRFFEVAYGLREQEKGEKLGLIYSRINNPNLEILEDRLAVWDKAEKALVFSSGMAAISTVLWSLARPGDVILYTAPVYGGTEFLLDRILPQFGILTIAVDATADAKALDASIADALEKAQGRGGKLAAVYVETPANPTNAIVDLAVMRERLDRMAAGDTRICVDNTLLGPIWQSPLECGADFSIYSLTKYVGGHSDVVAGAAMGKADLMAAVSGFRTILGTMLDPHSAWLLARSLETLELRMTRAGENALKVATWLRDQPQVEEVQYLGFVDPQSPRGEIFAKQCKGAGSTFAFRIKGGEAAAFKFLNALKVAKLAVSLGGTETLASHPSSTTHSDYTPERKAFCGITDDLVRLSIGIEDPADLIADFGHALKAAA